MRFLELLQGMRAMVRAREARFTSPMTLAPLAECLQIPPRIASLHNLQIDCCYIRQRPETAWIWLQARPPPTFGCTPAEARLRTNACGSLPQETSVSAPPHQLATSRSTTPVTTRLFV